MSALAEWLEEHGAHHDVVTWARPFGDDWERAWRECPRGDWLLALAARRDAPLRQIVSAALACARFAAEYAPDEELRIPAALDATSRWIEGDEASREEVLRDCERAIDEARDLTAQSAAIAAFAALRSIEAPDEAASAASMAVQALVVHSAECGVRSAMGYAQSTCADYVREHVPFASIAF
jgi:hypothetical protein